MKAKKAQEIVQAFLNSPKKGNNYSIDAEVFEKTAAVLNEYVAFLQKNEADTRISQGNTKWSVDEVAALICELNGGFSLEIMAKRHGRTMGGILGRLEKLGLSDETRFI